MRTSMTLFTVMALAAALGTIALCQDTAADEEALEMLAAKQKDAWGNGDAQEAASIYAPDADIVDFMGKSYKGRDEIEKNIAEALTMYEGSQIKFGTTSIQFIRPDLAVWDGTWELTGLPESEGTAPPSKGLYTAVVVKQEGQWLIASELQCVPPPIPTTGQD